MVTYQPIYEEIEGRADCVGCDHINYEADSEDTVTWIYDGNFNGLERRGKRNKTKKVHIRLGARPNNSKMSKKDREGSLDPASLINRFGDVGLGLESESGLMEIEHDFHNRDGHAREGSMTSVQEAASAKHALETVLKKIEGDRIGVEGGKLKTDCGKGGLMWQEKCATLTPPMLGHEIEEKLVAEN
ncbi:hypothetical protein AHAS_Ahas03G0228700 [Arachis hypogaea]